MNWDNPAVLLTLLDEPDKRERLRELLVERAKNDEILAAAKAEREEAERIHERAAAALADATAKHSAADERHAKLAEWEQGIANANASMSEEKKRFEDMRETVGSNLAGRTASIEEKEHELDAREAAIAEKERELDSREELIESAEQDHNARVQRLKDAIG